jgi:hypothetical protein
MRQHDNPARPDTPGLSGEQLAAIATAARLCARPVRLRGWRTVADAVTGEVISAVRSDEQPGGMIEVPCGNRRAAVCPSCAWLYKGDLWQVMAAGLRGGHGIPEDVSSHPAVFVTLTAPGFGLVHRGPGRDGQPARCRPRHERPVCEHGRSASCGRTHQDGEQAVGQPLCPECFDYQWASADLLRAAVLAASAVPSVTLPGPDDPASMLILSWGNQIDVRAVRRGTGGELDEARVAAYIAKYASKATEDAGGIPQRIRSAADLEE